MVRRPPVVQGLLPCIEHEARIRRARRAPADDVPRIGIDGEGDVDEAGLDCHIGEARGPQRIRARCPELAVDVFERASGCLGADRGYDRPAADDALQTHGAHQARHCAAGNGVAFAQQLTPYLPHAIDAEVLLECPQCLGHHRGIAPWPRRLPGRVAAAGGMRVVGGWGDRQQLADRHKPACLAMIVDEGNHGLNRRSSSALAEYSDALRGISLTCGRSRFSRSSALSRTGMSEVSGGLRPLTRSACFSHSFGVYSV